MSIGMIAETVNTDKETVRRVLCDELNIKKVFVKFVPKNLTPDQKLICQQICSDFLERIAEEPELIENITCYETWKFQYDVEIRRQSMYWKTCAPPRMKNVRVLKSNFKAMLNIFLHIKGIVITE